MTIYAPPTSQGGNDTIPAELIALAHLEATCNGIRLRIAGLSPDQIYRGTAADASIAELVALAVEREKVYLQAVKQSQVGEKPDLVEPEPTGLLLDRVFNDDLSTFFAVRRATLDVLRTVSAKHWENKIMVRGQREMTLRELAMRLDQHDAQMLSTISTQRRGWLKTNGVDELRDSGVAGKLSPNIAQ
ncbi:MAG: hypothetical protein H0X37_05905 [Herpetosiphonaceae bacterium]|nr:hypothetical protein [Herpetosiphonaceae bacterium]